MHHTFTFIVLICASLCSRSVVAQADQPGSFLEAPSWNYSIGLGADLPVADLADRFGSNLAFKLMVERQTGSGWLYSLQFDFMFGNTVKEDVFETIRLENGRLLGANNTYASILQRMRGAFLGLGVGRFINLSSKYKSGLKVSLAAGILQHQVRIVDDERSFPQIDGDYLKGYDRMTRGLGLRQFIGWQYLSEDNRINLYAGVEFLQGFTNNVRAFDFDSAQPVSTNARFDGAVGFRVGFIVPFYGGYTDEEVFY